MGTFFKRQSLINSFPSDFVDIHSHVLPHLDDGSSSMEEAILLLNTLNSLGISKTVCTPHIMEGVWENTSTLIDIRVQQVKDQLQRLDIPGIGLKAAAEYMIDDNFRVLLQNKQLMTFGDNLVLIEIHFFSPPMDLYEVLFQMQMSNYKPVIAHPERYTFLIDNFDEVKKLKKVGCLFQLNLLSVGGFYGKKVERIAKKMLKEGMYDLAGTDTHNLDHIAYLKKIKGNKLIARLKPVLENNTNLLIGDF